MGKIVQKYSKFLKSAKNDREKFVMVPRKFFVDHTLTPQEKLLWMILAGFQYKAESYIFPGRERLAALLGVRDVNYITKLTRRLQRKGVLEKHYGKNRQVYYFLFFCIDIDEDEILWRGKQSDGWLKPSSNNTIRYPKNDSDQN